jgi:tetratricopeptide (TPR) repeat protein
MCDNLIEFWDTRGHYRPALRWTESLLSRAHQSGSLQSRAMLVRATAKAAGLRGKFGRQRDLAQELLTIADALDDPFYRAEAHRQHGTAQVFLGDLESARSDFSVVIGLRRLQEDEALLADAILNLAVVDDMAGKHELAIAGYEDAQRRYRHLGHTQGLCKTTNNLAALLEDARRFDEAFVLRQEALSLARGIQLRSTEALSLEALGTHYGRRGEIDKAFDCNLQALAIYRQIGDPRGQTAMLNNLADTCLAREQLRSAASFLADACELLPDHPDLAHEEFVFGTASKVLRRSGRQEAGLRFLIASIELHRRRQYQHERHLRRNEDRLDKLRDSFDPSTFARIREDGKTLANDPGAALGALRELLSSPGVVVDDSSV